LKIVSRKDAISSFDGGGGAPLPTTMVVEDVMALVLERLVCQESKSC
jgi:hypothetical protein